MSSSLKKLYALGVKPYAMRMHIYFSGIGGAGIGPLALVALQAGYTISGSDKQDSQYVAYLRKHGIHNIHIGQSYEKIATVHNATPIDWYVYSSAVSIEQPTGPEFKFCQENSIKISKRDELLNQILTDKELKLIAVAGTHGKTTTTALLVWLFTQFKIPVSYILPAKTSFADMGHFNKDATYFIYECDEFDRNFLAFKPFVSIISGVSWDHHEIFPTRDEYKQAFREFITQSEWTELWQSDNDYLGIPANDHHAIMDSGDPAIENLQLAGRFNRMDAWLAAKATRQLTGLPLDDILTAINHFPGLQRRMETIIPNLYSDYAHTPEKIRGAMSVALETAKLANKKVVVVYEPLTDRRQHHMLNDYTDCFKGADRVYWLPSYLAREDPNQPILTPAELISHLSDSSIAEARTRDEDLKNTIRQHLEKGDMVVGMAGGGGGSLDEWLRHNFC